MGYDVTFHPVGQGELDHFVFDVLDDPSLGAARAAEITKHPDSRELIESLYADLPAGLAAPEEMEFICACIAGFLHPYWYARGQALSSLLPPPLFTPMPKIARGRLASISNSSRGGFIEPHKLTLIESLLPAHQLDEQAIDSLRRAIRYAQSRNLGLIEASDVVMPIADSCQSSFENLRAHFINRLDP